MTIAPFTCHLPVAISFGDGVIGRLPDLVAGASALGVVEELVAGIPSVESAVAGMRVHLKQPGEPHHDDVAELAGEIVAGRPAVLIAIGGGSALDLAKAARLVAGQGEPIERFLAGEVPVRPPDLPLIAVPTTSGTGSEVSGGAVILDRTARRKLGVASPLMRAQHALVDPLLTVGLPPDATMYTGVDALAQAIGGVIVSNRNPLSEAIGLEACRHVAAGLPAAVRDGADLDARRRMSLGSLMAGLAMNLSDCGADHALGHSLGSTLSLPHGLSVGLVLAETLEVNRPACAGNLERVADALGEPAAGGADGARAVRAVRRILASIGFPTCAEAGVSGAHLERMVGLSLADYCLTVNPKRWDEADVRSAYDEALALTRR
jgi:choline dehydrogenase